MNYTTCKYCNGVVSVTDTVCEWCGKKLVYSSQDDSDPGSNKIKKTIQTRSGYIYLLNSGIHYKIGKTNSYERREKEIKLQLPFKAIEIHKIQTNNIDLLEAHWHQYFKKKRKNGEWFKLSKRDIEEFSSYFEIIYKKTT